MGEYDDRSVSNIRYNGVGGEDVNRATNNGERRFG